MSHKHYRHYGGRGITVCDQWQNFTAFLADMGHGQAGLTLDRIDNSGGYCRDNCRWVSTAVQARNTRRNHWIVAWGERRCLKDWESDARCSVSYVTIAHRLRRGVTPEDAIAKPGTRSRWIKRYKAAV